METLAGYEGKEIYRYSREELETIKNSCNEKEIIKAYLNLNKSWYYQTDATAGRESQKMANELKHIVQQLFEKAGWEAHIERDGDNTKNDCYIHDGVGFYIAVHQVPFASEWNIELTDEELFNGDKLRPKNETLELLKKRVGEKNILNEIKNEIDELDLKIIEAILKNENLNEIQEIEGTTFRSGSQEFKYYYSYKEAEDEVRERLSDGEFWRMAVEAGNTFQSLDDWIEDVINIDGVFHILATYDGIERFVEVDGETYYYCRI